MGFFQKSRDHGITPAYDSQRQPADKIEMTTRNSHEVAQHPHHGILPSHKRKVNHNGDAVAKGIHPDGESGRRWFNPWKFLKICFRSASNASCAVNILWPVVPAAIAVYYVFNTTEESKDEHAVLIFTLNYIAMVPCANLVGFAGQELSRKLPKVFGVLVETTLGSITEIILFMVLLQNDQFLVIQAAILGSILATLLLCLGMCFFVGGMRRDEQEFDGVVSEVGNGLLLTAYVSVSVTHLNLLTLPLVASLSLYQLRIIHRSLVMQ